MSLPSRERGLKWQRKDGKYDRMVVAPLAGAWIEIDDSKCLSADEMVAPLAGAWIEIFIQSAFFPSGCVAPLAGAWIEIFKPSYLSFKNVVAPLAGAWIEISVEQCVPGVGSGRSPRGSVD